MGIALEISCSLILQPRSCGPGGLLPALRLGCAGRDSPAAASRKVRVSASTAGVRSRCRRLGLLLLQARLRCASAGPKLCALQDHQLQVGPCAQPAGQIERRRWDFNVGWVLAANLAADPDAWTRLLGLHDDPDLADAEPDTLRYRLWHVPARLASHARRRILKIPADWPWAGAITTCWRRLVALPDPG